MNPRPVDRKSNALPVAPKRHLDLYNDRRTVVCVCLCLMSTFPPLTLCSSDHVVLLVMSAVNHCPCDRDSGLQLFQQELSSRQVVADAIRGAVDNSESDVSAQISSLNRAWQEVVRLAELRDSRLNEAFVLVGGV